MRMMGAESVAYHRETVMERGDDHAGQVLGYYASRGETPLLWGGSGAERLGLVGAVTADQYEAIFGPGGARDPLFGHRLVATRRPGMELVISAHKSVAELGVIGRAEDMHRIMDAERDATLDYLDTLTRQRGARRGRGQLPTVTSGLTYAVTRHATSRAGDPCPHDHVLLANVVETLDEVGGWKAADTNVWRDHLHAATVVGRAAAARVAVELGYGIEPDAGASGRLGHWRIAGVPDEVLQVHSKRAAEITAAVAERGYDTYQARNMAARATRAVKRNTPVDDLLPVWRSELQEVGWPAPQLAAAVDEAAARRVVTDRPTEGQVQRLVTAVVTGDGDLCRRKVFTRADAIVAVAPQVYGLPATELRRVLDAVFASPEVVPLLRTGAARERAYSTVSVIAAEVAIADHVARGTVATGVATVPTTVVEHTIAAKETELGGPLTAGQAAAVRGICTSGRRVSLVLGVAGAGKTTALDCVRSAYETAGYTVIGTATSGQAARTLGREAGVGESRTLASLLWRLDHHQLTLSDRHVIFLDEAGMTDDPNMLRLLVAAEAAGATVILVGDHHQLGPVGPGGSLGALIDRHGGHVYVLSENVRQADHGERWALSELRHGDVDCAVSWYRHHGRIAVSANRDKAIDDTADAWADDALAGRDVGMYAWRRANVEALNEAARVRWEAAGRLTGPELQAPGGGRYRAGDRIVTLAPGGDGQLVTSERGVVHAVDPVSGGMLARMDDGRLQQLTAEQTTRERLAHGYGVTVHRSQGATVDIAHRFEDGGGRELAYVAMSRARQGTTVHVVADDVDQAVEDLRQDWSAERRPQWAIDTGTPADQHDQRRGSPHAVPAVRRAALEAERDALAAIIPPDRADELRRLEYALRETRDEQEWLDTATASWGHNTELLPFTRELRAATAERVNAEQVLARGDLGWRARRRWRAAHADAQQREQAAQANYDRAAQPFRDRLVTETAQIHRRLDEVRSVNAERNAWLHDHPDAAVRLARIDLDLDRLDSADRITQHLTREIGRTVEPPAATPQPALEVDLGMDLGL
jgi:conjugative relaxase-like TrwC/TraI family protein